jgi:hypothetical protein
MKLNRNLLCIIAGCLVLLLLVCGCQHKEESEEIYQEPNTTQEDIVDLEALEYEYTSMINLTDKVLTVLSEEDLTMTEVTSLIKNKIDSNLTSREFEKKVKEITSSVISELFKILWQRNNFWKDGVKR